jgi:predicted acetyltransferase
VSVEVRLLTADDDLGPELDLSVRAFGPGGEDTERALRSARATVEAGQHIGAFDGADLVASARYFDMRQWWHGRSLTMAGVAGVKVAPEERGRGVGRAMMTGLLQRIAERGYPLSVLYPATSTVYRSVGWEVAGGQYQVKVPARALRALVPPDGQAVAVAADDAGAGADAQAAAGRAVRRAGPGDAAEMIAIQGELAAEMRACGPVSYDAQRLAFLLEDPAIYCYLAADGMIAYRWNRGQDELLVHILVAGSAETTRALWSIAASHASMVGHVRSYVSPADPVTWLVPEPEVELSRREMWMLRLVDAPAAIAGRGFPEGAAATVPVHLADPQLPANAGRWLLEIGGGKGALTRAESAPGGTAAASADGMADGATADGGELRLGPRGLAAMYAGTPLNTLRRTGLATGGDPAADAALDEAFTCTAYMFEYF